MDEYLESDGRRMTLRSSLKRDRREWTEDDEEEDEFDQISEDDEVQTSKAVWKEEDEIDGFTIEALDFDGTDDSKSKLYM
jgi:hypothetical protein